MGCDRCRPVPRHSGHLRKPDRPAVWPDSTVGGASSGPYNASIVFNRMFAAMDPKLLELLVCPVTKGPLTYRAESQELVSLSARLAYPIRDGIPVLLENEARTLSDDEIEAGRQASTAAPSA